MTIRRRIKKLEALIVDAASIVVTVVFHGKDPEEWKERAIEARDRGHQLRTIVFVIIQVADTPEEATAIIDRHRAKDPLTPMRVYMRGKVREEVVLAEWDPPLPSLDS